MARDLELQKTSELKELFNADLRGSLQHMLEGNAEQCVSLREAFEAVDAWAATDDPADEQMVQYLIVLEEALKTDLHSELAIMEMILGALTEEPEQPEPDEGQ